MTTGATQAPASSAATPPMLNARRKLPRPAPPMLNRFENLEKSIVITSNIASASTTKIAAMPMLNQGDALMVPNVPAVRMTMRPRTPYTAAIAAPYALPRRKPRRREPACAPAPMIARLIGIIGSTHGVRFKARPPMRTMSSMAATPRSSRSPRCCTPDSALRMKVRKSSRPR